MVSKNASNDQLHDVVNIMAHMNDSVENKISNSLNNPGIDLIKFTPTGSMIDSCNSNTLAVEICYRIYYTQDFDHKA